MAKKSRRSDEDTILRRTVSIHAGSACFGTSLRRRSPRIQQQISRALPAKALASMQDGLQCRGRARCKARATTGLSSADCSGEMQQIRGWPPERVLRCLNSEGMPFAPQSSDKYRPMQSNDLGQILYDFKLKMKSSPMVQLADLYLRPICIGGYHASNRTYARLMNDGKLMRRA